MDVDDIEFGCRKGQNGYSVEDPVPWVSSVSLERAQSRLSEGWVRDMSLVLLSPRLGGRMSLGREGLAWATDVSLGRETPRIGMSPWRILAWARKATLGRQVCAWARKAQWRGNIRDDLEHRDVSRDGIDWTVIRQQGLEGESG
ncbi:unnamed protein product [Lupinus luteus]|uniref:Uncharacterized protein n=1 Tax=Lupinus luteus TaxID=3873 RepID=A0AAV1XWD7_LUPLU